MTARTPVELVDANGARVGNLVELNGIAAGIAGQEIMANSLPVVIASDQSAVETQDGGPAWETEHQVTNSADMTGAADVTGDPTVGQHIIVTDVVISVGTVMNVTLLEETSGTVVGGPYYLPANGTVQITPRGEWRLPIADRRLRADASVAGNITVEIWYHSEA
jgi:hypothetical protein